MATAGSDGSAVWAPNGDQLFRIEGDATCVHFLRSDGRVLVAGFSDGTLAFRNLDGSVDGIVSPFGSSPVVGMAEVATGSLVVASQEGSISMLVLTKMSPVSYEV